MKKLLLLLCAFLTIGVGGVWADDYNCVKLTFSRADGGSGTATNAVGDVTVNVIDQDGNAIAGVSASLTGMTSSAGSITQLKTGSATALSRTTNSVLAPDNGYDNQQNSTIEYTLCVTGLSTDFVYNKVTLDVYALTSGGVAQANNGETSRIWDFDVQTGSTEGGVTSFVSQTGNDICTVPDDDGDLHHKNWSMLDATGRNATSTLYIKVILKRTDENGCYAGLGAVTLRPVVIWESKNGWSRNAVANIKWFGVHTPEDASTTYHLTSIQLHQETTGNTNYLAIARVSATSSLDATHVVAISDNSISPSTANPGALETYTFSDGVDLLGGTTYYLVFLSSNLPTDGAYTVQEGRCSLNTGYGSDYTYGSSGGARWWPYFTATMEYSLTTGFCTGDILGGSMLSGNWQNTWTSGTSPSFTLTSSANNINNSESKPSGVLDIRSGQAREATYTITAPANYVITGYKLFGKANTANQTVTPNEGGSAVVFTTKGNSMSVSGLRKFTTSFTLTDTGNSGLYLNAMQVSLSPANSITLLPTTNTKAYVITNARGTFTFANDATSMSPEAVANTDLDSESQQIALIYYDSSDDEVDNPQYYLFSVNAGKYLTANNTLTSMPTDNEQISITPTGNATYPWFFKFKNVADKNFNVATTPSLCVLIDDWDTVDEGNRNAIIEAADFDSDAALEMFNTRSVTYNLSYGVNSKFLSVDDVTVAVSGDAAEFVPSSFVTCGVNYSYSPATINAETTEVTVTATWNGPFQISADHTSSSTKWYTLDMHSNAEKYTWYYDSSDDAVKLSVLAADAYQTLATTHLFCFVGNPWDGFKIYNKAAGNKTLHKASDGAQAFMTTDSGGNLFKLFASNGSIANSYCFKRPGDTKYLNEQSGLLQAYFSNDQGSSVRFFSPGSYYVNYIDGLYLDAPVGAVGTPEYFFQHPDYKSTVSGLKTTIEGSLYSSDVLGGKDYLDPVRNGGIITLTDGYYRFVNAFTEWVSTRPTTYYNSVNNRIEWSVASNSSYNVNSIFYIDPTTPSIYSPNAGKYMSVINSTVSGSLAAAAGTTVFTSLGSAQYNVVVGGGTMHTAGHSSGSGTSGNLTSWGGGYTNTADAWYIVKIADVDILLHSGGDGYYYATLYLPFDVTIRDADAFTLEENEGGDLLIPTAVTDNKVPAGTPVLIKGESETATATINTGDAFNSGSPLDCDLTGTYTDNSDITGASDYFLGKDATEGVGFYHWDGTTLGANRAYIPAGGGSVKGFKVLFGDDTVTAISLTRTSTSKGAIAVYDLSGRRVQKPAKGLYIVNGKKMAVR